MTVNLYNLQTLFSNSQLEEIRSVIWLITGVAGFIGSNQLDLLLALGGKVVGIDDFSTGLLTNLPDSHERFTLIKGSFYDTTTLDRLREEVADEPLACIHLAALASVPMCSEEPQACFENNVGGSFFLGNYLHSLNNARKSLVFASSSAVYGDCGVRAHEGLIPNPASIYGASKLAAETMLRSLELPVHALRYFNVFGPRQRGDSSYSGVISKWIKQMQDGHEVWVYGDGRQTRDFVHVSNIVYANILASLRGLNESAGGPYNVATGRSVTLLELFELLQQELSYQDNIHHASPRSGDIVYSQADVSKITNDLGFEIITTFEKGLSDLV